jgi:Putative metal-binding motif
MLGTWSWLQGCSGEPQRFLVDSDRDGWPSELDCNDDNRRVFPSADDIPGDGIDQDCSGKDAEAVNLAGTLNAPGGAENGSGGAFSTGGGEPSGGMGGSESPLVDSDGDGFRASADCDDEKADVHPGALDVPWDGMDQDCSGEDSHDRDGDGFDGGVEGPDCDDTRSEVFPGAVEIVLNRVDENCDGSDLLSVPTYPNVLSSEAVVAAPPALVRLSEAEDADLLVVWVDARRGDARDILAQRLSKRGERIGEEIAISRSEPNEKRELRVVSQQDGFIVTWITDEGGYAQQLSPTGEPAGIALGIAESGATGLQAAFGGANLEGGGTWGFVWSNPTADPGEQTSFRSMTLDEVRSEIFPLGDAASAITYTSLVGTDEGFLPIWEGNLENTRGIVAERRDRVGTVIEDSWLLREGAVGEPTIGLADGGYSLVYRLPNANGYVAALFLDNDFGPTEAGEVRVSGESSLQFGFQTVALPNGLVVFWNDGRHLLDAPAVESVYGQYLSRGGSAERLWGADRAIFAGFGGHLGASIALDDRVLVAVQLDGNVGLFLNDLASDR